MLDVRRRPEGRLFYWLLAAVLVFLVWSGVSVPVAMAAPATTRVSDIVYRADGNVASGVVLISWPAFTAADGTPVAAGSTSVALGNDGLLSVDLVPNAGAAQSGIYYTAVFQLDDVVRTEYWVVGTTSPETLAVVRATPGSGVSAPAASKQYVDSAIAANKAYVDQQVSTVGSGSYVSKNGDAMTGPLTLPADPTGTNQASTKHYVDTGLAAKANLVSGVVPAAQLGSGSANGTLCLKGDSTWGACGSSGNATTIQNIPVDTTAPTDGQTITYDAASAKYKPKTGVGSGNATALQGVPMDTATPSDGQVVTYDASSGRYKPKPGTGLSAAQQSPKYAGDYAWTVSPSTDLSAPGAKTVTLASCPVGVYGVDPANQVFPPAFTTSGQFSVYVAGTGTPEAAVVTGGTCNGDGNSGTLQFTTVNAHSAGYTLSSVSGGIFEATVLARIKSAGAGWSLGLYLDSGMVRVGPGYIKLYAPLNITTPYQTIDFSGSTLICAFDDDCIKIQASAVGATLISPRGQPTVMNGQHAFIADYTMGARIYNVKDDIGLQVAGQPNGTWGKFGYGVVDVVDEAMLLDGMTFSNITCNASFCGSAVYAPGPFNGSSRWPSGSNNASVAWIKHLNLSLGCQNGVDWQSGNVLRISDSIIQGYGQFGVRTGLSGPQGANGGYGMTQIDNLYEEIGGCANPLGNVGIAGVIVNTGNIIINGGEAPQGSYPQFANTGSTEYQYWEIPKNAAGNVGNPLWIGHAKSSGSDMIPVTFYSPLNMVSFDVVRATGDVNTAVPTGTGAYAVATGVTTASSCNASNVCTVQDTNAALQNYTMPQSGIGKPQWYPILPMGAGGLILGGTGTTSDLNAAEATLSLNQYNRTGLFQNNVAGMAHPVLFSQECLAASPGAPLWQVCGSSDAAIGGGATVWSSAGGSGLKGRLNFQTSGSKNHIITLVDSAPERTFAMPSLNRPSADANDAYIGCDTSYCLGNYTGIMLGAPVSISNYIGNAGDGTSWKERLTATAKTFNVPVSAPGYQIGGSYGSAGQCLTSTGTGSAWAACGSGGGSTSPLTTKGDLWGFSTLNARVPVGSDGQCLTADSTNALGVKWGSCGTGAAQDSAVVHNTGTETVGGDKTFTGNVTLGTATITGNVAVQGTMTVSGAWQVESAGPLSPMTAATGDSKIGFDTDGKLKVSENSGAVVEVAKVNQIPAAPVFQTNGTNNSSQGTLNLIPGANVSLSAGSNGAVTVGTTGLLPQGPMYQPDANTVEQRNGTSVQTDNFYGSYTDANNWDRLRMTPSSSYFQLLTETQGTGQLLRGICFGATGNGACNWGIDVAGLLKPISDNAKDIGGATARPRDVYVGRNLIMSGTMSRYNGIATSGIGLEPVYATVSLTGQTAAVGAGNLCGSPNCTAGQYEITYYVDSTATCATPGTAAVSLNIGWTDETGTKSYSGVPIAGSGGGNTSSVSLGNTTSFGSGQISLWTTGANAITYNTTYTACTSGTGTYSLRIAVKQMQ